MSVSLAGAVLHILLLVQVTDGRAGSTGAGWLEWSAPVAAEGCPSGADFAARVDEQLRGAAPRPANHARARIRAVIQRSGEHGWLAEARLEDARGALLGRRTVSRTGESCGAVSDALVLVTALLMSTVPESPVPSPPPPNVEDAPAREGRLTAAASVVAPAAQSGATAPRAPGDPRRWAFAIDAGTSTALGLLPGLAFSAEARASTNPPGWPRLFVAAALWSQGRAELADGRGASVRLWTAGAGLCPARHETRSRVAAVCLGTDVGPFEAAGFGFSTSLSRGLWFWDAALSAEVRQAIAGGLFAEAGGRVVVPILRPSAVYGGPMGEIEIYRPWPVAAMVHLGVGYSFR